MISMLMSIIDRLIQIKKYSSERLKYIFSEILEPIFNDLSVIHSDYIEMFRYVEKSTPFLWEFRLPDYEDKIRASIKYLEDKRVEFEPVRSKIRIMVDELKDLEINSEVDSFIESVIKYFPRGNPVIETESEYTVSEANEYRSASVMLLDNLTELINSNINNEDIKNQIKELDLKIIIQQTIQNHQSMWEEVCRTFIRLKVKISM
jgi:hypothetical protein